LMLESTRNDRCEGTLPGIVLRFGDSKLGKSPWLSEVESEQGEIASGIGPSKSHGNLLPNASESAGTKGSSLLGEIRALRVGARPQEGEVRHDSSGA
jgi:hypothetical protein